MVWGLGGRELNGSSRFPVRNPDLVKAQHELYWELVGHLYYYARERYLRAVRFLGVETELYRRVKEKDSLDHRVLQPIHDEIAGYYDHKFDTAQRSLEEIPGYSDPRPSKWQLFRTDNLPYEQKLRMQWCDYFHRQARELAEIDSFAQAILTAVAYQNTEQGYDAEGFLLTTIKERYPAISRSDLS